MFAAFHASAVASLSEAPVHSCNKSSGSQGTIGSEVSSIVKVASLDTLNPHSSVTV